jgi:hypothetical protein
MLKGDAPHVISQLMVSITQIQNASKSTKLSMAVNFIEIIFVSNAKTI